MNLRLVPANAEYEPKADAFVLNGVPLALGTGPEPTKEALGPASSPPLGLPDPLPGPAPSPNKELELPKTDDPLPAVNPELPVEIGLALARTSES